MALNVRETVNKSAAYLGAAGVEAPRLEAELLVGQAVRLDRTQLYVQFDRIVNDAELEALRGLLLARAKDRMPVAYLTGRKAFLGFELLTPRGVFIPRPETEELVAVVADRLARITGPFAVLDLCTGSGAIALALARKFPLANVLATDIAPEAVAAARANAERLGLDARVEVASGDLWAAITPGSIFDAIVSNPPYIPQSSLPGLPPDVARHEPRLALDGGIDGLAFYRLIMAGLDQYLRPGGQLGLEHGDDQAEAVGALATQAGLIDLEARSDLAGRPRVFLATKGVK